MRASERLCDRLGLSRKAAPYIICYIIIVIIATIVPFTVLIVITAVVVVTIIGSSKIKSNAHKQLPKATGKSVTNPSHNDATFVKFDTVTATDHLKPGVLARQPGCKGVVKHPGCRRPPAWTHAGGLVPPDKRVSSLEPLLSGLRVVCYLFRWGHKAPSGES